MLASEIFTAASSEIISISQEEGQQATIYVDVLTLVGRDVGTFLRNTASWAGIILDSFFRWIPTGYIKQSEYQPNG